MKVLAPGLFLLVHDVLTKDLGDGVPWEMAFADDIVSSGGEDRDVEVVLKEWKRRLED